MHPSTPPAPKPSDLEVGQSPATAWFGQAFGQRDSQFQSPGSFIGSANSQPLSSFEIEDLSSSGGVSWRLGMPWFPNNVTSSEQGPTLRGIGNQNDEPRYYGGLVKNTSDTMAEPSTPIRQMYPAQIERNHHSPLQHHQQRNSSYPKSIAAISEDSIADFDESEWTPPDSAYGAACPVCGWIPKEWRRIIEVSMIGGLFLGFVYLVVTTSIHITNDRKGLSQRNGTMSDYRSGGLIATDDDFYVAYNKKNDDNSYRNDDGKYYSYNNKYDDKYYSNAKYDDKYNSADDYVDASNANDQSNDDNNNNRNYRRSLH